LAVGLLLAQFLLACWATPAFANGPVRSETGFEGAVTVAKEQTDGDLHIVTADVPYLDVRGRPKSGQARLYVRGDGLEGGKPRAAMFTAYYELDLPGAKKWAKQGWVVVSPHYGQQARENSAGNGFNLDHAIVQWVRRLGFVDRRRLHVDGSSQGGYVALALAADFLPVEAVTADAPIINWDYNLCYWQTNKAAAELGKTDYDKSPLPFLCPVIPLADQTFEVFGASLTSDTYYDLSPLAYLDRITSPVLATWSTADMLVPLDQVTRTRLGNFDPSRFPAGYVRDFDALTRCPKARKRLEEALPADQVHWEVLPLPQDTYEFLIGMATKGQKRPNKKPAYLDLPWSADHQWSVCLLDEGGPAPQASHRRYVWSAFPDSFIAAHRERPFGVALLNAAKLDYLLQRYMHQVEHAPKLADGRTANRLNYELLEKRDVVAGLLDYAGMGEAYARNLVALYATASRLPFGASLDIASLQKEKGLLERKLSAGRSRPF
jgi:fermentation-respiration switch protein FrsA (DUF1100 family)